MEPRNRIPFARAARIAIRAVGGFITILEFPLTFWIRAYRDKASTFYLQSHGSTLLQSYGTQSGGSPPALVYPGKVH